MRFARHVVIVGALSCSALAAQPAVTQATYRLNQASSLGQGCLPPCLCVFSLTPDFRGTFSLSRGPLDDYRLTDINWLVGTGPAQQHITGSGTYSVRRLAGDIWFDVLFLARRGDGFVQRMVLNLRFDGGPVQVFDSGLVPGGGAFPNIVISVSPPGAQCVTTLLNIDASPVPSTALQPQEMTTAAGFSEGCISGLCRCPVILKNLGGTFDLVRLGNHGGFEELALVDVQWLISGGQQTEAVRGVAVYRIDSLVAPTMHEFLGRLEVGSDPAKRFSSGVIAGGAEYPLIKINAIDGNTGCINQMFSIDAAPH